MAHKERSPVVEVPTMATFQTSVALTYSVTFKVWFDSLHSSKSSETYLGLDLDQKVFRGEGPPNNTACVGKWPLLFTILYAFFSSCLRGPVHLSFKVRNQVILYLTESGGIRQYQRSKQTYQSR